MLVTLGPVLSVFNEAVGSGMSLGAQGALGENLDTSLMKSLGLSLTTVREYAQRVAVKR